MGYQKKALIAFGQVSIARVLTEAIKLGKVVIFARLLDPTIFGVFGGVFLIYSFLDILFQLGTEVLLLQKNPKQHLALLNTAWVLNVLKGLLISLLVLTTIPFSAHLYPDSVQFSHIILLACLPLLRGFISLSQTISQKNLAFGKVSTLSVLTVLLQSLTGVTIIYFFHSPTGLIVVTLLEALIEVGISWLFFSPRPQWVWSPPALKALLNQARWMNLTGITNHIFHQFDDFVVGKVLGATSLGIYQMAYTIGMVPISQSANLVSQVALPTFTLVAHDQERLRRAFYRTLAGLTALTLLPVVIFFIWGELLVTLIFGSQWMSVFPVVYILLIFGALRAITGLSSIVLFAVQKEKWVSSITMASCCALLITIVPLIQNYGLLGGAYSALIGAIASLPWMIYYTYQVIYAPTPKS